MTLYSNFQVKEALSVSADSNKFSIEIIEGHDSSSYFWFNPVLVKESSKIILDDDIHEFDEEFSIEQGDIECFLVYFFFKYFDENLLINKNRYEYGMGFIHDFEWHLTHNFYTYATLNKMAEAILSIANLLESDYDNTILSDVKKGFSIFYMCNRDYEDYKAGDDSAIENHVGVVIDFYRRFAHRLKKMMESNPQTEIISIVGP